MLKQAVLLIGLGVALSCLIQVNDECKPNRELLGGDDRTNQRKFDKADWWASRIVAAGAGNHSLPR